MGVEQVISTEYVQESLPNLNSNDYKALLFDFHRRKRINYPRTDEKVKERLMYTALGLDKHERNASIWKCKYRKEGAQPIKFLVRKILDAEKISRSQPYIETSVNSLLGLLDDQDLHSAPLLENEDYEYLYYVVVSKIRELYVSLQLCYASHFVKLDTILYNRAVDLLSTETIFTVETLRDFLITAWHVLHDETVMSRLDKAIKNRKIKLLILSPLTMQGQSFSISSQDSANISLGPHESALWNTVQGLQKVDNCAALLNSVYEKYSLGHHQPIANMITKKTSVEETLERLNESSNNSIQSAQLMGSTPIAGTKIASLLCSCKSTCDCKFVCNQYPDACICRHRPKSLGSSSRQLDVKNIILHSPPKRGRGDVDGFSQDKTTFSQWNEAMVLPKPNRSRLPIPAGFRTEVPKGDHIIGMIPQTMPEPSFDVPITTRSGHQSDRGLRIELPILQPTRFNPAASEIVPPKTQDHELSTLSTPDSDISPQTPVFTQPLAGMEESLPEAVRGNTVYDLTSEEKHNSISAGLKVVDDDPSIESFRLLPKGDRPSTASTDISPGLVSCIEIPKSPSRVLGPNEIEPQSPVHLCVRYTAWDQKSFRIPFEDNKYFIHPCQPQKYVKAGGNLPLDMRSEVGDPFSRIHLLDDLDFDSGEYKIEKHDRNGKVQLWIDGLPESDYNHSGALGRRKSSREKVGKSWLFGFFS